VPRRVALIASMAVLALLAAGAVVIWLHVYDPPPRRPAARRPATQVTNDNPRSTSRAAPGTTPDLAVPKGAHDPTKVTVADLQAAAAVATRYAAAISTWRYDQPDSAWVDPLVEISTGEARQQAHENTPTATRRTALNSSQEVATAAITGQTVVAATANLVTIRVEVEQAITSRSGTSKATTRWSIDAVPEGGVWKVSHAGVLSSSGKPRAVPITGG